MKTRNLKCPSCEHTQEEKMKQGQTAYRCKGCEKLVRAVDAPKTEKKKEEPKKVEEKKEEAKPKQEKKLKRSKKKSNEQ